MGNCISELHYDDYRKLGAETKWSLGISDHVIFLSILKPKNGRLRFAKHVSRKLWKIFFKMQDSYICAADAINGNGLGEMGYIK